MSRRPVTYVSIVCDWPGCGRVLEYDDFCAFDPTSDFVTLVDDCFWLTDQDGERHYCDYHPTTWESDHEHGEPYPRAPFILINDPGDGVRLILTDAAGEQETDR